MRGRFIALPEQGHAPTGAASGLVPADGRWLIEQCEAASINGTLRLRLSGLGWKWVDVDRKMNTVRQYVYFNAAVEMEGPLQLGYDASARIASVFMLPKAQAAIAPVLPVHASPDNFIGGILDVFVDADEHARDAVASEGSAQFQDQLARGITVTFDVTRTQPDVSIGPKLGEGVAPMRPFGGAGLWFINERQALHVGGIAIAGPFPPGAPAQLDIINEQGGPLRFRVVCSDDAANDFHGFYRGLGFVPLVQVQDAGWAFPGQRVSMRVPAESCSWVLVTAVATTPATLPGASTYAAVEVRPTQ
jgi:hypothetical protein